jgi:hypothetical protein
VMLVDKTGVVVFANTYASGASSGDEVSKVALQADGSTFTAVGTSRPGVTRIHFLLTFDNTGGAGIVKNIAIGSQSPTNVGSASIAKLYMQSNFAFIIYSTELVEVVD